MEETFIFIFFKFDHVSILIQGTWPLVSCQWVAKMVVVHNNSFEIQAVHNEFPFLCLLANEANLNADPT